MTLKTKIDNWISENYEWFHNEIATNIAKDQMSMYATDLSLYMIGTIYDLPEEKVEQLLNDDMMGWYLLTGAGRQLRSSTSPFYRTYRQHKGWAREDGIEGSLKSIFEKPDVPYNDDLYECFIEAFEELHWYQKKILSKHFYEGWTLEKIYRYYNIGKIHLIKDINTAINEIRTKCQQC